MPDTHAHTDPSPRAAAPVLGHCALLADYALFSATGADAATFLHGQLTNDVAALEATQARLAGFCTAKGRLLATMVVWRDDAEAPAVHGFMHASLAESVIKRLRMFVLRAKVAFETPTMPITGVWADESQADALGAVAGGALPRTAWQRVTLPTGTWIAAPHDARTLRWWWICSPAQREQAASPLLEQLHPGDQADWMHMDVIQGMPWIEALTQDLFIPQTVNLDLIDGVSFTKGCYPGQEIVARSHYLGKVKRRMTLGTFSDGAGESVEAVVPGADVFEQEGAQEACGRVINLARRDGVTSVLLETTLTAMALPELRLGIPAGPAVTLHALPYPLA